MMSKKIMKTAALLSMLIAMLTITAPAADAITLYDSGEEKFDFYGRFGAQYTVKDGDNRFSSESSRFGFKANRNISEDFTAFGHVEFGLNYVGEGDATTHRLLYGGLDTPYGALTCGRQYGSVYDVVSSWTDYSKFDGSSTSMSFGLSSNGIGRTDGILKYSFNKYGINAQAQYIAESDNNAPETGYAAAASYSMGALALGAGYNSVELTEDVDSTLLIFGVKYSQNNVYAAANIAMVEDMSAGYAGKGLAVEAYAHYHFENGLRPIVQISHESSDDTDYLLTYVAPGLEYHFVKNSVMVWVEYSIRTEKDADGVKAEDNDQFAAGFRYIW